MTFFKKLPYFGMLFLFFSCSSDQAKNTENTGNSAITEEIQTLDSLNTDLDQTAQEIESSTKALEDAIKELDDQN